MQVMSWLFKQFCRHLTKSCGNANKEWDSNARRASSGDQCNRKKPENLVHRNLNCALAVLFCVAPDFSPLICGIDPGWPNLSKFVKLLERATKEFGANQTLYVGVITLLKLG